MSNRSQRPGCFLTALPLMIVVLAAISWLS